MFCVNYNAKYVDGKSVSVIPAKLNKELTKKIIKKHKKDEVALMHIYHVAGAIHRELLKMFK